MYLQHFLESVDKWFSMESSVFNRVSSLFSLSKSVCWKSGMLDGDVPERFLHYRWLTKHRIVGCICPLVRLYWSNRSLRLWRKNRSTYLRHCFSCTFYCFYRFSFIWNNTDCIRRCLRLPPFLWFWAHSHTRDDNKIRRKTLINTIITLFAYIKLKNQYLLHKSKFQTTFSHFFQRTAMFSTRHISRMFAFTCFIHSIQNTRLQ